MGRNGAGDPVMGLPKAFTGSIITARDSANGVLAYIQKQNSYRDICSTQLEYFFYILSVMPIQLGPIYECQSPHAHWRRCDS